MKLYDVTLDLFIYLVTFRLRAATGVKTPLEEVRKDLMQIFREQEAKVQQDSALMPSYNQVKYPLVVFSDEMILNSNWETRRKSWQPMAMRCASIAALVMETNR